MTRREFVPNGQLALPCARVPAGGLRPPQAAFAQQGGATPDRKEAQKLTIQRKHSWLQ